MPREEKKRQMWSTPSLEAACRAVQNKEMGTLKASKTFGVPRSTIRDYIKKSAKAEHGEETAVVRKKLGRKPVLTPDLEK